MPPPPSLPPIGEAAPVHDMRRGSYPFPFVIGVGRSGTTLLRSILDAHRDLAVVHESRFVGWMAQNRGRYERNGSFSTQQFLADLLDKNPAMPSRLDAWGMSAPAIRAAVEGAAPRDLAEAVRVLYASYAARHGKSRYADKTPGYIACTAELARLFPEARFIHLVRDGRDVALSMLDVDFGGVNIPHAAWLWSRRVRAAQRAGHLLGPDRYLLVRYEDLLAEPARVLAEICDAIDLPFDPVMLQYFETPDRVAEGLGSQQHHDHLQLPLTVGLRDWRTQMPPAEVQRFESVAGDLLVELGYESAFAVGRPAAVTRVRIAYGRAVAAYRAKRRSRAGH